MIEFEIPLQVVPKGRARTFVDKKNKYKSLTPQKTRLFEMSVRAYALKYKPTELISVPIRLTCDFYLSKPKKPKHQLPAVRPDIDNYLKTILDACNKVIWFDDAVICEVIASKKYTSDYPKILIKIEYI